MIKDTLLDKIIKSNIKMGRIEDCRVVWATRSKRDTQMTPQLCPGWGSVV